MDLDSAQEDKALRGLGWHSVRWTRTLSGVELAIPRIGNVDRLGRWCLLLLLFSPLLGLVLEAVLPVVVSGVVILALVLPPQANQATLTVTLSPQALRTPAWSVPLADIEAVLVKRSWRRCWLSLVPKVGPVREIEVPGPLVGRKLAALIERHSARRRTALEEEGHDVRKAALPPAALSAVVRSTR